MTFVEIKELLAEHNQLHVLKYYDRLNDIQKRQLIKQIESIDLALLDKIKNNASEKRRIIEPLSVLEADSIAEKSSEYKKCGIEALRANKVGAVLLAGGQGTRLGFDKPKGTLDIGSTHTFYIFESLINNMMKVVKETGTFFPLYIMTSDKNNAETISFFEEHKYFGYDKNAVTFFVQEMAPSVDFNGKLLMDNEYTISMSPNGNGGWFSSLYKSNCFSKIEEQGLEWLSVFAVDNVLQQVNDPEFVGATILSGCDCGAKVISKNDPHEKVGVLCLEDGKPSIVEYYEITDEMANERNEKGELLYKFGVILNYMFKVSHLRDVMNDKMPVHVVEKKISHIDDNGNLVVPDKPNGYKFETLVLDMIHLMNSCLPYEVIREKEFAPIKNPSGIDSPDSARELLKKNGVVL